MRSRFNFNEMLERRRRILARISLPEESPMTSIKKQVASRDRVEESTTRFPRIRDRCTRSARPIPGAVYAASFSILNWEVTVGRSRTLAPMGKLDKCHRTDTSIGAEQEAPLVGQRLDSAQFWKARVIHG